MPKTLAALLDSVPGEEILSTAGALATPVTAPVVESSREVERGGLFVARAGQSADGHDFIPDAIASGAAAIVGEKPFADQPVPYILVRDGQAVLGPLAAAYHDHPSRKLVVIGVTGTDGKTTTCRFLHGVLRQAGLRAGFINTISADFGREEEATGLHVTTPGAPRIQALLARMVAHGASHCVLEMTSHGLAQSRLNAVAIDVAVMTNVTHEHLDYHGSWEAYREAKAAMFRMLAAAPRKPGIAKTAVINADDPSADFFAAIPAERRWHYGIGSGTDLRAKDIAHLPDAIAFRVGDERLSLPLLGEFNVYNALAAVGAARSLGLPWAAIRAGLAAAEAGPGRMERIDEGQSFIAIVDFAHTPNALERALEAGRGLLGEGGRLIAVFGSAGLRDVEKRDLMARTSARLADVTVLTAEDPRTESLDRILAMMARGCVAAGGIEGETFFRARDRGEAIFEACRSAGAGDVVMACGKGHEQSMCFGAIEYPWDDREAMRTALRGAPLATLPTASGSA